MGKIVFAAPPIARFHLHQALGRQLLQRGNDVIVLAADPVTHRFYRTQGMRSYLLPTQSAGHQLRGLPLGELARRDLALAGERMPQARALARRERLLGRTVPGLLRWFGVEMPDLVIFHEARSGTHRLVDYVAREFGCDVLHTGEGLLPGTMQWDQEGIDGDSSKMRATAQSYAKVRRDEPFLTTALAAVLGESNAEAIEREPVRAPGITSRLGSMFNALARGQLGPARHGMGAWRRARRDQGALRSSHPADSLPDGPFVAVLLQEPTDPRLRLDADHSTDPADLAVAAYAGTMALDGDVPIVLIAPDAAPDLAHEVASRLVKRPGRHLVCAQEDTRGALAAALAVVTVNHPHALVGVLADTPVLHTGRALYGAAGVTTPTTLDRLRLDLAPAVAATNSAALRESFLTRCLVYDHVWCDPAAPDRNGLGGLVQHVESRLANLSRGRSGTAEPLDYRAGPLWPTASLSET